MVINHAPVTATSGPNAPAALPPITVPITPAEYVALCLKASAGLAGFVCGASWNQMEYLRQFSVKDFANWCAALALLPECAGTGASAGWVTNLSQQGQGIVLTLTTQGLTLPATDPRT